MFSVVHTCRCSQEMVMPRTAYIFVGGLGKTGTLLRITGWESENCVSLYL